MTAVNDVDVLDSWEEVDDKQVERVWGRAVAAIPAEEDDDLLVDIVRDKRSTRPRSVVMEGGATSAAVPVASSPGGVRILKRPGAVERASSGTETRTRPVRTLQQRQREYEAARLRILGQARCPDDADQATPALQFKIENGRPVQLNRPMEETIERTCPVTISPQPGPTNRHGPNGVSLLRAPKGPDSSRGFHLKR